MPYVIRQMENSPEGTFKVSSGSDTLEAVALPNPARYPVKGYPKLRLLSQLKWYFEDYPECPTGENESKALAVMETLRQWKKDISYLLFPGLFPKLRAGFLSKQDSVRIVSDSPATLSWPWEILCDPGVGALARCYSVERQPQEIGAPICSIERETEELHILFVISRPDGSQEINYLAMAREVLDYVSRENLQVTVDVLRPATFENLKRTLEIKQGYYHIVHFDGHGAYSPRLEHSGKMEGALAFENDKGGSHNVCAMELERFFTGHCVPMVVLNACQSAMIDEQAENPFASVAPALLRAGVRSVVAMGYKLCARGARVFVPQFYAKLLKEGSVTEAVIAARQAMYEHAERESPLGWTLLQDWMIPQTYQRRDSGGRSLPLLRRDPNGTRKVPALNQETAYHFVGREKEAYELEKFLRRRQEAGILIHGMLGAGKTTLAKGFLIWFRNTGGLREDEGENAPVFWLDFRYVRKLEDIVEHLEKGMPEGTHPAAHGANRMERVLQQLKTRRVFFVWDSVEAVSGISGTDASPVLSNEDYGTIKGWLRELYGGRTRIFILSRKKEDWLSGEECVRLPLEGLTGEEMALYVILLAHRHRFKAERSDGAFVRLMRETFTAGYDSMRGRPSTDTRLGELLRKLDGNPLATRAVLLNLNRLPYPELMREFERSFPGRKDDESAQRILSVFHAFSGHIDENWKPVLQVLSLMEYFTDAVWIAYILASIFVKNPVGDPQKEGTTRELVEPCLSMLEEYGLCTHMWDEVFQMHPALRGCLLETYPATEEMRREFVEYCCYVAERSLDNKTQRYLFAALHKANFYRARKFAETFNMRGEWLDLTRFLAILETDQGEYALAERLYMDMAKRARQQGGQKSEKNAYFGLAMLSHMQEKNQSAEQWTQKFFAAAGNNDPLSFFTLGQAAEKRGDFSSAEQYYQQARDLWRTQESATLIDLNYLYGRLGYAALKQGKLEAAEDALKEGMKTAGDSKHPESRALNFGELGRLAMYMGKFQEAQICFMRASRIFRDLDDQYGLAAVYNNLGHLFTEKGDHAGAIQWYQNSLKAEITLRQQQASTDDAPIPMMANNYEGLGRAAINSGDAAAARGWWEEALKIYERQGDKQHAEGIRANLALLDSAVSAGEYD